MASFILNEDEYNLTIQVRELAVNEIAERAGFLDGAGNEKPDRIIPELLARHNLLFPTLPLEYGGRGLSMTATASVIEELAVGDAGAAATVVMNVSALTPVMIAGTQKIKNEILPELSLDRPRLMCTAVSEENNGCGLERLYSNQEDITRIATTAYCLDDKITIHGEKKFVMNGASADFAVVLARSKESQRKSHLQMFIVPVKSPGVAVTQIFNKMGMRSCKTAQIKFDHVEIPADYQIGGKGSGYLLMLQTIDRNLPLVGAIGVGIARGACELALEAVRNQSTTDCFVSSSLVEMSALVDAARLAVKRAAYFIDLDENYSRVAILAKLYATQVAQQVTSQAVDVIGRFGFIAGHPIEKYMRDAQMLSIIAGSDGLHRHVLAEQL